MRLMRLLIFAAFALAALPCSAQEWTRFRGPNGGGIATGDLTAIPARWSSGDYRWQVDLPGVGHSSPVIWGSRLFLTSGDSQSGARLVLCYDTEKGKRLWRRDFADDTHHTHQRNSYASSTPVVDAERVYVTWATPKRYTVVALDHDGHDLWRKDLGAFPATHGFGCSPILYEDLLLVPDDHKDGGSLVALDRRTGNVRWKKERGASKAAYSTPVVYEPPVGKTLVIFSNTADGLTAIDPATGETVWQLADVFPERCVGSPVVVGDLVLASCGSGGGGRVLVAAYAGAELDAKKAAEDPTARNGAATNRDARSESVTNAAGGGTKSESKSETTSEATTEGAKSVGEDRIAYRVTRAAPYVPTPVAWDGLVFLWHDGGTVTCLDAASGQEHWRKRIGGSYSSSPICVAGRIYCVSHEGEVVVLAAEKEYRLLARNELEDLTRATPAVSGGRMYLRTATKLFCVGGG